jgi:hypothetical protein
MTQSLAIINRIAAVLTGTLPNSIPVYTDRVTAFDRDETPAVLVVAESEDTTRQDAVYDRTQLLINIEIIVRADNWQATADPYADAINSLIQADPTLLSMIVRIRRHAKKWEAHEADITAGTLTLTYDVMYLSTYTQI